MIGILNTLARVLVALDEKSEHSKHPEHLLEFIKQFFCSHKGRDVKSFKPKIRSSIHNYVDSISVFGYYKVSSRTKTNVQFVCDEIASWLSFRENLSTPNNKQLRINNYRFSFLFQKMLSLNNFCKTI
jgi:hypothetical protein